ncbi:5593_t:CDS:2, partial [Acaulospora colombiana]
MNAPDVSPTYLRDAVSAMYAGMLVLDLVLKPNTIISLGGTGSTMLNFIMHMLRRGQVTELIRSTGVMHTNTAEDIWNGYHIPKGTIIIPNVAFMMRDPRIWGDDANDFKPERFLVEYNPRASALPDVESVPFGFGRRYASPPSYQ